MTPEEEAAWQEIETAATAEGKVTYYSLGSIPEEQVERLQTAFAEEYPGIEVEYLFVGNGAAMTTRVTTEQESQAFVADVVDHSVRGARLIERFFDPFVPPAIEDPTVEWLYDPLADPAGVGTVNATFAQFFPIFVNTELVPEADFPKNQMDVATNPKWKNQIIMRRPWTQGGGTHLYHFAKQEYGTDWITAMVAQAPTYSDDQDAALLSVARGEFAIGVGMTGRQAAQFMDEGLPLAAIWPDDFVITSTQGHHLAKSAPHPNAAKVFINWMMTDAGQQLWADLGQYPLNPDIAPAQPWMAGVRDVPEIFENLQTEAEQEASNAEAASYFETP